MTPYAELCSLNFICWVETSFGGKRKELRVHVNLAEAGDATGELE